MAYHDTHLTGLFHALGDPTRLSVVEALCQGPQPASRLAEPHDMALPSFLKHLKVLEEAGLVTSSKSGRVRTVTLRPDRLREADSWFTARQCALEARLDRLGAYLDTTAEDTE